MKLPVININKEAIQAYFKTDQGLLLISMGVALLFWFMVKLSQDYKANREIALTYELPKKMSFMKIPPKKINYTLAGRGWDLMYDYFGTRDTPIQFQLNNTPIQNITNSQLKNELAKKLTSSDISIFNTNFDYISIELGQSASKRIPILLNQELTFAPGHQLKAAIKLHPDSLTLFGPVSLLAHFDTWSTTLLDLKNLKSTVHQTLALQPNPTPQVELSTKAVAVHIPVEQFTEKSIFLPVTVKNAPDSLKVFPNKVKISFAVGLSQYDTIIGKHFQLEVDLQGVPINQANNTAPILLTKQPTDVKNVRFSPKAVSFLFVKE